MIGCCFLLHYDIVNILRTVVHVQLANKQLVFKILTKMMSHIVRVLFVIVITK